MALGLMIKIRLGGLRKMGGRVGRIIDQVCGAGSADVVSLGCSANVSYGAYPRQRLSESSLRYVGFSCMLRSNRRMPKATQRRRRIPSTSIMIGIGPSWSSFNTIQLLALASK